MNENWNETINLNQNNKKIGSKINHDGESCATMAKFSVEKIVWKSARTQKPKVHFTLTNLQGKKGASWSSVTTIEYKKWMMSVGQRYGKRASRKWGEKERISLNWLVSFVRSRCRFCCSNCLYMSERGNSAFHWQHANYVARGGKKIGKRRENNSYFSLKRGKRKIPSKK